MQKKSFAVYTIFIAILVLFAITNVFAGTPEAPPEKGEGELIISTATTGGTYYPIGVGMASLWSTYDHFLVQSGCQCHPSCQSCSLFCLRDSRIKANENVFGCLEACERPLYYTLPLCLYSSSF